MYLRIVRIYKRVHNVPEIDEYTDLTPDTEKDLKAVQPVKEAVWRSSIPH
jgi:hypothetical protein